MHNLNHMMCLDIYLNSLSEEEYEKAKHNIKPLKNSSHPLICWDIASLGFDKLTNTQKQVLQALQVILTKNKWQFDWRVFNNISFETLVLTDLNKRIQWVDNGFYKMTGYPKSFALGKKPTFLQGKKTDSNVRNRINENLSKGIVFTEQILNYKKNGTEYLCEVTIYPIKNYSMEIQAFLALEKQIRQI